MQDKTILNKYETGTENIFSNNPEIIEYQDQVGKFIKRIGLGYDALGTLRISQTENGNIKIYQQQNNGRIFKDRSGLKDSFVLRISDHNRKEGQPKYINPKTEIAATRPIPNLALIKAYNSGQYPGTLNFHEGISKALADENPAYGFNGKFSFNINDPSNKEVREYITKAGQSGNLKKIGIYLDNDDYTPKRNEEGIFTAKDSTSIADNLKTNAEKIFRFLDSVDLKNTKVILKKQNHLKGYDDLKEIFINNNNIEEWRKIVNANDEEDTRFFITNILKRTTFKTQIDDLFGTRNFEQYYNRHQRIILDSYCIFKRIKYSKIDPGTTRKDNFEKLCNKNERPIFQATIKEYFKSDNQETNIIQVKSWIKEGMPDLIPIYQRSDISLLQAPTGSGKTSENIEHCIKNKIPFVLAVPLQSIAKQQEQNPELTSIISGQNFKGKDTNGNLLFPYDYIVCPYDSLYKIPNKERYWLIFDEGHNLFNLWGNAERSIQFRAKPLRKALKLFQEFKKVLILSATMPDHLQTILEKVYPGKKIAKIQVQRLQSNSIHLNIVDTKNDLLDFVKFQKSNPIQPGFIGWCQLNNIEKAHKLKVELITNNVLKENQIILINKKDLDKDEKVKNIFTQITKRSEIQSSDEQPLLIITTCIIGEGININNLNIQQLSFIDNRSAQDFIQVSARCRQAKNLDVFLFTDASKKPGDYIKLDHKYKIEQNIKKAFLDLDEIEHNRKLFIDELEYQDLSFSNEILEQDTTREILSSDFDFIYLDKGNNPDIDYLKIGNLHQRKYDDACDLALFLGDILKAGNVFINGFLNLDDDQDITLQTKILDDDQDIILQHLQNEIATKPNEPIKALYYFYKKTNQPDKRKRIERYCPDLETELKAIEEPPSYYQKNELIFKTCKYLKDAIRCYIYLRMLDASTTQIIGTIEDFKKGNDANNSNDGFNDFNLKKNIWTYLMGLQVFKDPNQRRKIANLKTRNNLTKIRDLFNLIYTFKDKETRFLAIYKTYFEQCKLKLKTPDFKPDTVYRMIISIFDTQVTKTSTGNILTIQGIKDNPFSDLPKGNDFKTFLTYLN